MPHGPATPPRPSILILYGSETGNSQDIAEEVGRNAERLRFSTTVEELNAIQLSTLLDYDLVVFIVATTGQGDIPQNGLAFWKSLLRKKLPPTCLRQMKFTAFGLGDSTYPKFNWAARKLRKRVIQLGAHEFYQYGEADERDPEGTDTSYLPWSTGLTEFWQANFPLQDGVLPIPEEEPLPIKFPLKLALSVATPKENTTASLVPLPISGGLEASIVENRRVTPLEHWQDVRHVKLDILISPESIHPGDCLTIYPQNTPEDVQKLIGLMDWASVADCPLDPDDSQNRPRGLVTTPGCTLRDLLLRNIDITAVPRRSFLKAISYFASDEEHKRRLLEFTQPEYTDEFYDYATRPRRTILEALEEFWSVRVPVERVLDTFPLIRGRDFSIANGGDVLRLKGLSNGGQQVARVELLVALVRYKTILRKLRQGLCSRFLAPLQPGTRLVVAHKPTLSRLHGRDQAARPLVAIGTGTGIAPIRALIQERLTHSIEGDRVTASPMVLCFGCRNQTADFHFHDEWTSPPLKDRLTVFTAFSRDQREKVYVQDLLVREAALVADMVRRDALFLICGGSNKMAEACRLAVVRAVLAGGLAEDEEGSRDVVGRLTWWQEIW